MFAIVCLCLLLFVVVWCSFDFGLFFVCSMELLFVVVAVNVVCFSLLALVAFVYACLFFALVCLFTFDSCRCRCCSCVCLFVLFLFTLFLFV